ncbi:hypothetical protein DL767_007859 [Monosporascus sp. MG133]|nr:hypothetical protein DL767_007859 [Monosporascus sp. MG133]
MARSFGFLVGSLALYDVVLGLFSAVSKNNVALYYASSYHPNIDVIILSLDFGNQCWAETYAGPGYGGQNKPTRNRLLKCPDLQRDLYTCRQTSTKKILLPLGGGTIAYQLRGAVDGENLAKQLWWLPGSASAASPWFELTVRQAANLANAYYCRSNFRGVAIWDATYASQNVASDENLYQNLKAALNTASTNKRLSCVPR